MKITTLADGSQMAYIKVEGFLEDRWIFNADSKLTTNRAEYAQGFLPGEALVQLQKLVSLGYEGLSLTNALPSDPQEWHRTLPVAIGENVVVLAGADLVETTVTGRSMKDAKPTIDCEYDHALPSGEIVKGQKWIWPEQVVASKLEGPGG